MPSRLIPEWVRGYERGWLRGDVVAGVTVAAYAIPQVMAYAEVAGLNAVVGLWALAGGLLAYTLVGSSRTLSVGPESTTSLMTAAAIGAAVTTPDEYASLAVALCFIVAGICALAWAGGLARISDLLSRPVMIGYMAGIAIVMIVSQYGKLTQLDIEGDGFWPETRSLIEQRADIHWPTLILGVSLALAMIVANRVWTKAPVALVGMLVATALVAWTPLREQGLASIGHIAPGFPSPTVPHLSVDSVVSLLVPALAVALVAFSDNILTARAFAGDPNEIDSRRELLALSAANVGSGLMQGFPVSSSGSRTAISSAVGAKSQAAGVFTVLAIALAILTVRPVLEEFRIGALGAVVVYAATKLIEVGEFRRIWSFRHSEFLIAIATTLGVLAFGILEGILVAVALSLGDLLRRVARPHDSVLGFVPGVAGMHDIDDYPEATTIPGLMVYRYDSPLFFANAEDFRARALRAVHKAEQPVEWFVLNAEAIIEIDVTAADALESLRQHLTGEGVVFAIARLKQDLRDELKASGLLERVTEERIFPTLPTAVQAYEASRGLGPPP